MSRKNHFISWAGRFLVYTKQLFLNVHRDSHENLSREVSRVIAAQKIVLAFYSALFDKCETLKIRRTAHAC